jgi:hypothetical protein
LLKNYSIKKKKNKNLNKDKKEEINFNKKDKIITQQKANNYVFKKYKDINELLKELGTLPLPHNLNQDFIPEDILEFTETDISNLFRVCDRIKVRRFIKEQNKKKK